MLVALIALAVTPVVTTFLRAAGDWVPTGDTAVIVLRSDDVLGRHTPLIGMPSSVGQSTGDPTSHPGPAELWVVALASGVLGTSWAPAAGLAAVHGAAATAVVLAGSRLGRLRGAAVAAAGVAVLGWSLQGEVLFDPYNPYAGLFPLAAFLAAAVASLRDGRWLPVAVGFGSFAAQAHLMYVPAVVAAGLATLVLGLLGAWRGGGAPRRPAWVATGAVAAGLWWPVVVDQVAGSGNLTALLGASGDGTDRVGWSLAVRALVNTAGTPTWLDPGAGIESVVLPAGAREAVPAALLGIALLLAAARSPARSVVRQSTAVLLAATAAGLVGLSLVPDRAANVLALHNYLWLWVVGAGAAGVVATRLLVALPSRAAVGVATTVAAAAALAATVAGPSRPLEPSWAASVRQLAPELAATLRCDATYVLAPEISFAADGIAGGLLLALERDGLDVRADPSRRRAVGPHRTIAPRSADGLLDVRVGEPRGDDELAYVDGPAGVRHAVDLLPGRGRDRASLVRPPGVPGCP